MTITIHMLSTALSPITHMRGVAGNVALLSREAVLCGNGDVSMIPCLSGNALRHKLVREPAADLMCKVLGLADISYQLGDFLYHGGRLTKASALSPAATKDLLDAVPFLALLGGALPGQILEGCLKVSRGLLVCRESAHIIERRSGVHLTGAHGIEEHVGAYLYTRGAEENNPDAIGDRMIYEGECVNAGSYFYHTMTLESEDKRVLGCLLSALQNSSHTLGGMGRIGHGELATEWASSDIEEGSEKRLIADYEHYLMDAREAVKDSLLGLFGEPVAAKEEKPAKPAKAAKKKAAKAEPEKSSGDMDFFGEVPTE